MSSSLARGLFDSFDGGSFGWSAGFAVVRGLGIVNQEADASITHGRFRRAWQRMSAVLAMDIPECGRGNLTVRVWRGINLADGPGRSRKTDGIRA